jgi:hypothetical protein
MTDHSAAPSPAPTPAPTFVAPPAPGRTNALAIVSFVTSLLGMGLVGVICGHISLVQIRKSLEAGRGLAIAGLIIGYLELLGALIIIVLLAIFGAAFFAHYGDYYYGRSIYS